MAATQPLVTVETFKGDFTTSKLLSRLSDRILDQYDARVAAKGATARNYSKQAPALPYDSVVAMDQLLMQFERADKELQALRKEIEDRVEVVSREVGKAEKVFEEQSIDFEENVAAMSEQFSDLETRMTSVASVATKFGDRLQNTDAYRNNAEEAIRCIQALQEFATVDKLKDLPDLYHDDNQLAEAAALSRKCWELASEVTKANERVNTMAQSMPKGKSSRSERCEKGTIEYARQQVEHYRNQLEHRILLRFDKAEAKKDLADMNVCASVMAEMENSQSSSSLVQRYISTRRMFVDPKELALGHSEPVVDTNTALAAKRRLGTLYKSILHAVRQEANIMKAVFAKPQEALMAFVQRLFEQRIQNVLGQMLLPPASDASREMLEAYLKLLAEAYQSTCALARNLQELVGDVAEVMELVEGAFSGVLEKYPDMEMTFLRLQYYNMPNNGPRGILLQDPVIQYFKWNQEALDRVAVLCTNPVHRAEVVRQTVHNSKPKEEDVGCLLEQVAVHLMTGLDGALQQCLRHLGPPYSSTSLPNMHRATVRQAALRVVEQEIGPVLGSIAQAGSIIKMLQAHYLKAVAPMLEDVPQLAQLCFKGFATILRAVEDRIVSNLEAAITDFFNTIKHMLQNEQKRADYRPSEELPPPLDQATEACCLVSSLLAAVLKEASQTLQAANLISFNAEMGERALKLLKDHMMHYTYSSTGALRWKRDVTEYAEALAPALQAAPSVRSKFEELKGEVNILVVAPESLLPLVDSSLRLPHAQALQYVRLREDFKTAKVKGKTLAMIFSV